MGSQVIWTLKGLKDMLDDRRKNRFDANVLVTGNTGLGKSTLINKLLRGFQDFNMKKHLIYSRRETIDLLEKNKFSYCWNDELISSGNRRKFWDREQIELIETLTKYRCNYNIFCGALPLFFSLDKELLKLFSLNIDIINRGIGIVHMRRSGRRYTDDPWDTKYNSKLEEMWSKKFQKNPNFRIPYEKYSTFAGYVYFSPLTKKQEQYYETLRDEKKKLISDENQEASNEKLPFAKRMYELLMKKRLDQEKLQWSCESEREKYSVVITQLNRMLKDNHAEGTLKDFLNSSKKESKDKVCKEVDNLMY